MSRMNGWPTDPQSNRTAAAPRSQVDLRRVVPASGDLITLFADASYSDFKNRGGWGAWAKDSTTRVYNGGGLFAEMRDSTTAEILGIWEGLEMCYRNRMVGPACTILVQCDNLHAVNFMPATHLKGKPRRYHSPRTPRNILEHQVRVKIDRLMQVTQCQIYGRHVPGHKNDPSARTWVNNLCDKLASKGRKMAEAHAIDPGMRMGKFIYQSDMRTSK